MPLDAALIQHCADPSLTPAIVEQFVEVAGSVDPLAVTVRVGSKSVLVPKPATADEALVVARQYVGEAVVRAGVTLYPAGLGLKDRSELSANLFDPCKNLGMGTTLFGKLYRITTKWYGTPVKEAFDDAIVAYRTGYFDGQYVFDAPDPGDVKLAPPPEGQATDEAGGVADGSAGAPPDEVRAGAVTPAPPAGEDPNKAGIAIDLSGIKEFNK